MARPGQSSWLRLKRLARYLGDDEADVIDVFSDSDWAGCKLTRKSTSRGFIAIAGGAAKTWSSSTQKTIARSSGEAEYYSLAAAEGLGFQAVARDLGWEMPIRIWVDSTAAKWRASRTGLCKGRDLEVSYMWVQQALKEKKFELKKISELVNPSDLLTKPLSAVEMKAKLGAIGGYLVERVKTNKVSWADIEDDDEAGG